MNDSNLVSSAVAAEIVGVSSAYLVKWFPWLEAFPKCVKTPHRAWLFPRKELVAWAHGRDIKAAFVQAKRRKYAAVSNRFDCKAAVEFLSGQYLPAEKRTQHEFKKIVARRLKPKTTRVHLVHDWMIDQEDA